MSLTTVCLLKAHCCHPRYADQLAVTHWRVKAGRAAAPCRFPTQWSAPARKLEDVDAGVFAANFFLKKTQAHKAHPG